jgi:hypothetical protein
MNDNDKERLQVLLSAKIDNELDLLDSVELNELIDRANGVGENDLGSIEPVDSLSATLL